jgi:hypothetical protein
LLAEIDLIVQWIEHQSGHEDRTGGTTNGIDRSGCAV